MSYIIKLISENCYLIPDDEGWLTTIESKQEAMELGLFDDMDGFTRYGISTGVNAAFYKTTQYEAHKEDISQYLNERFRDQWEIKLVPVHI